MTSVASPLAPTPSGAPSRGYSRPPHPAHALTARGYLVIPPAERAAHRVAPAGQSIHQRILSAFYRRMHMASTTPSSDPSQRGLTNAELSHLLGHRDLHRRTAELRACGLLSQDFGGEQFTRECKGTRGVVMRITAAGVAALNELVGAEKAPVTTAA